MSVINITKENFNKEIFESKEKILLDFWAPWCGPCKMLGPVIDELASEVAPDVKVCKVNVDEEQELAAQFNIFSIPTVLIIENQKVVNHFVGYRPKQSIKEMLDIK